MAHLSIKNIGPIKDVDIELNRINIFLGPQSSGKSTIAKLLSFCQWLQKDAVVRQGVDHINDGFVEKNLIEYHNISSYLRDDSEFHYCGRCVDIDFAGGALSVKISGGLANAEVAKNAYIPSERNIIGVPQSLNMDMPYNYLRSFLSDWLNVRDKYRQSDSVRLMDLGASYYYNESSREDMIMVDDMPACPIPLSQASSGLQSTTPLFVYIKYLTEWIYQHDEDCSPQRLQMIREGSARGAIYAELNGSVHPELKETVESLVKRLANMPLTTDSNDILFTRFKELEGRLKKPGFSNIIVEEPEQNLFPQTQAELIYNILGMLNRDRDNLTITTHSPFVIYALNNCMMAYIAGDNLKLIEQFGTGSMATVNPAQVSVWELRDGRLKAPGKDYNETIQDENGLIRDNYFDRIMKGLMVDFKNMVTVSKA